MGVVPARSTACSCILEACRQQSASEHAGEGGCPDEQKACGRQMLHSVNDATQRVVCRTLDICYHSAGLQSRRKLCQLRRYLRSLEIKGGRHTWAIVPGGAGVPSMVSRLTTSPARMLACTSAGSLAQVAASI